MLLRGTVSDCYTSHFIDNFYRSLRYLLLDITDLVDVAAGCFPCQLSDELVRVHADAPGIGGHPLTAA